jgi:hypothetical protein
MTLYNLKTDGDQWRITKFTNDLDVESSYLLSETECECPAGSKPTCRHRQMLPTLIAEGLENTSGFWDFENKVVLVPEGEQTFCEEPQLTGLQEEQILMSFHNEVSSALDVAITEELAHPPPSIIANPHPSIGPIKRRI